MTARSRSRWCCRRPSRICSPMARRASPSAWRPSIPPHNRRRALRRGAVSHHPSARRPRTADGPSCRGRIFRPAASSSSQRDEIVETYRTGRGSFRVRARWAKEELGAAAGSSSSPKSPTACRKSRLIEKIAELISEQETAARRRRARRDRRKTCASSSSRSTRTVDPALMMETLFKLTELETRDSDQHERARRRRGAARRFARRGLRQWLDHRRERAAAPLAPPARRDRPAARSARRHAHRLPQSRRGDPHHPRGGRAEGRVDKRHSS